MIYPVDSTIQHLNNRGQDFLRSFWCYFQGKVQIIHVIIAIIIMGIITCIMKIFKLLCKFAGIIIISVNLHNSLTVLLFGVFWDYARKVVVEIHKAYFRLGMHSLFRDTYNQFSDRHCWEWHQLSLFPGRSLLKIKAMKMFKIRQGPTLGVGLIENSDDQRRMGKAYTLSKWVPTYHVVNQAISFSFYQ